jgi:hypothetical protein
MPVRAAQYLLFLAQSQHDTLDRWGYHIRPVHYYEPLPDFRSITKEAIDRRREYAALDFNWSEQLNLLQSLTKYRAELDQLYQSRAFNFANGFFGGFDAAAYYALIRELKPRRVIEVGGGYSTQIAAKAVNQNQSEGNSGTLKVIEPFPEPRLTDSIAQTDVIAKPVQEVEAEFFSSLGPNDILFIDSSHTVKFGSDVCYLFLEILPTLKPGVWVHIHDIFFPNDYPAEWLLQQRLALNEQYLVEAFLSHNNSFSIRLSNHWLCIDHSAESMALQPGGMTDLNASSFWCQRVH